MTAKFINILVACEESQVVTQAFRKLGFNAFSCDIQPCKKGANRAWHIWGDVTRFLGGDTCFQTIDGKLHKLSKWHLIIAHPPCTYLCKASATFMFPKGKISEERYKLMLSAREFFLKCLEAKADYLAVENPVPLKIARLPRPTTYVEPFWYGHKYSKKTCLWLRNLPPLFPTIINPTVKNFVRCSRGKYRARTFTGVAEAMAKQWGDILISEIKRKKK